MIRWFRVRRHAVSPIRSPPHSNKNRWCCFGSPLFFSLAAPASAVTVRILLPKEFSLLNKVLFSLMGGLFLVVLIPQNLVYLGLPVRISAWLILGVALVQVWLCRHKFVAWIRTDHFSDRYPRLLTALHSVLLAPTFLVL